MSPSSAKRRLYFHPLPATQRGSTFDRRKRGCQVASGLSKLSLASTLVLGVQAVGRLWAPYQDQDVRSVGGSAGCREIDREDWTSKTLPSRSWVRRYDGVRLASFSLSLSLAALGKAQAQHLAALHYVCRCREQRKKPSWRLPRAGSLRLTRAQAFLEGGS